MSDAKKPPRIRESASHYGCIPRVIAGDARKHDLAPDECLLVAVLISAAMVAGRESKFARAMEAGRLAIEDFDQDFIEEWDNKRRAKKAGTFLPAPTRAIFDKRGKYRLTYKRGNLRKRIAKTGKTAFADAMKRERARWQFDADVSFRITRRALLRRAHLGTSGQHFDRLRRILKRLTRPILPDVPPLLTELNSSGDDLILTVSRFWLAFPYARVPLPWPIRSNAAVHLLLALQCMPVDPRQRGQISVIELGERIAVIGSVRTVRRALRRAIEVLNARIKDISSATIDACDAVKLRVPVHFKIEFVGRTAVRINKSFRYQVPDQTDPPKPQPVFDEFDPEAEADYQAMRQRMQREAIQRQREERRRKFAEEIVAALEAEHE